MVEFSAKHLMVSTVRGAFGKLEGHIEANPDDLSQVGGEVVIDVASINTGTQDRDNHLRSADFFDVEKYPTMRFVPTEIKPRGGQDYGVTGALTIRDITRPVELTARLEGSIDDPFGNHRTAVSLRGQLSRKEWGLTWNQVLEAGAVLVSDEIKLSIDVALLEKVAVSA
jgi:polyisoprenoid-binding protein YceI